MQIAVTAKVMTKKITVTFNVPDNKALNAHMAERLRTEDDEVLIKVRAERFDAWAEKIEGPFTKETLPDVSKAGLVFQVFEVVDVEKN
jgi:hypothetical protein